MMYTYRLRHMVGIFIFFTFILTTLISRQQLTIGYQTSFKKILSNHTVNTTQRILSTRSLTRIRNGSYPNLKYVRSGPAINCLQRPLNDRKYFDRNEMNKIVTAKYAYAWYVSRPAYLCSALAALKQMKDVRSREIVNESQLQVDYVLIFSADNFNAVPNSVNSNRTKSMFQMWQDEGGILQNFASLSAHLQDSYYKGCYEKLYVFLLKKYARVIIMDADGLAFNNLDHLFWLSMPPGIQIAAPQGYWFPKEGLYQATEECQVNPTVGLVAAITSVLLLVIPNEDLFQRSKKYFGLQMKRGHEYFDMDIINQEFSCKRETLVLPKMYGTLDSEYQKHNSRLSSRMSMCKNFSEVQYFHFSGLGKPWTSAGQMTNYLSRFENHASDLIKRWFRHAHASCPWLVPHSPL